MPGISTLISSNTLERESFKKNNIHLLHEDYMFITNVIDSEFIISQAAVHSSYPFSQFQLNGNNIFLLGIIYNFSQTEIQDKLKCIVSAYQDDKRAFKELLKDFVDGADGDFIIQIITENNDYLIFNDILSRLPLYYYNGEDTFICSSELKSILLNKPTINVSKLSCLEFILYEYNFGNNTLYSDIFKLLPGNLIIYTTDNFQVEPISTINFVTNNLTNKHKFLDECKTMLDDSCRIRVKALKDFNLQSDLSGGLDSRAIAGVLCKYDQIKYHTFEYVQDESEVAKQVLESLNVDITKNFIKYTFDNYLNFDEAKKFVFINDGLVNYYTTSVCYKDLQHVKQVTQTNFARFTGLGISDFIRKYPFAFKPFYTLYTNRNYKFGYLKNILEVSNLIDIDKSEFEDRIKSFMSKFKESNKDDILKRLYFDFQLNLVCISSEDRERIHFWTVPPMYSSPLMKKIGSEMKLRWTGYEFFTEFLNKIDPRLSKTKLYDRKLSVKYKFPLGFYDKFLGLKEFLRYFIDINTLSNKIYLYLNKDKQLNKDKLISIISDALKSNDFCHSLIPNPSYLATLKEPELMRIITIIIFLEEFSSTFNKKIVLNNH